MNNFNEYLMDYGIGVFDADDPLLQEAAQDDADAQQQQVEEDPNQQQAPDDGQEQDPQDDGEEEDDGQQQEDPQQAQQVDPNDPNAMQDPNDPNAVQEPIETPEIKNEEIIARYKTIQEFEILLTILERIKSVKIYTKKTIFDDIEESIRNTLKMVQSVSTDDLIEFKDTIIKRVKEDLKTVHMEIKKENKKSLLNKKAKVSISKPIKKEPQVRDKFDKYLIKTSDKLQEEIIEFGPSQLSMLSEIVDLFSYKPIKVKENEEESILNNIYSLIRQKIKMLDDDEIIDVFGIRYKQNDIRFILNDALSILSQLMNSKKIKLSQNLSLYQGYLFNIKSNVSILTEVPVMYDDKSKKIIIKKIPNDLSILEFVFVLRYAYMYYTFTLIKDENILNKTFELNSDIHKAIIKMISHVIFKTYSEETFEDQLNNVIDKYKLNVNLFKDYEYLQTNADVLKKIKDIDDMNILRKAIAAFSYLSGSYGLEYREMNSLFTISFNRGIRDYLKEKNYFDFVLMVGSKLNHMELIAILHAFNNFIPLYSLHTNIKSLDKMK